MKSNLEFNVKISFNIVLKNYFLYTKKYFQKIYVKRILQKFVFIKL